MYLDERTDLVDFIETLDHIRRHCTGHPVLVFVRLGRFRCFRGRAGRLLVRGVRRFLAEKDAGVRLVQFHLASDQFDQILVRHFEHFDELRKERVARDGDEWNYGEEFGNFDRHQWIATLNNDGYGTLGRVVVSVVVVIVVVVTLTPAVV